MEEAERGMMGNDMTNMWSADVFCHRDNEGVCHPALPSTVMGRLSSKDKDNRPTQDKQEVLQSKQEVSFRRPCCVVTCA